MRTLLHACGRAGGRHVGPPRVGARTAGAPERTHDMGRGSVAEPGLRTYQGWDRRVQLAVPLSGLVGDQMRLCGRSPETDSARQPRPVKQRHFAGASEDIDLVVHRGDLGVVAERDRLPASNPRRQAGEPLSGAHTHGGRSFGWRPGRESNGVQADSQRRRDDCGPPPPDRHLPGMDDEAETP